MEDIRKYLLLFFDRPMEPCFMPKGVENIAFKIPERYFAKYYDILRLSKKVGSALGTILDEGGVVARIIDVLDIDLPDLSLPMQLPRHGVFSIFLSKHQEMAARLVDVFLGMKDLASLLAVAVYCQLHMNAFLFIYSLSVALLHRADTKGIVIPTFAETFPDMFVDRETMNRAFELIYVLPIAIKKPVVDVDPPKVYIPEQRVAYFRDDFGINSHHWHWHLIYPGNLGSGVIVDKDRRGELFYYMHQQIIARYNVERFCNGLERVKPFKDLHDNIDDGVFPKLDTKNSSRSWALRFDNVKLIDLDRVNDGTKVTLSMMETWRGRILEAIEKMAVVKPDGTSLPLDDETGIDYLGNLVESTSLTVNEEYYGSFHNQGHNLIALVHDPKGYHNEQSTVMGDTATAMRDPFFYRWHSYINDIFVAFKDKLAQYESAKLGFPNITVSSIGVKGADGEDIGNSFSTLWERSVINLENGLDFSRKRSIYARLTYLQHEEFKYVFEVDNNTGAPQQGTVRIFMAPTVDEKGTKFSFEEQRKLMIEMDKFVQPLQPGKNTIERRSKESSVTIPYERILRDETENPVTAQKDNYCDCGWPQNLLLPKGNQGGYPIVLFVMVTNWKEDKVDKDLPTGCKDNASYCGLRDRKYPDRRAMGFPFDRRAGAAALPDFLLPNMAVLDCTIKFTDIIVDREERRKGKGSLLSTVLG